MSAQKKIKMAPQHTQPIEYTVYLHYTGDLKNRPSKWERACTTHDRELAMEQAQMLFYSEKYERVEIQKKFFCKNNGGKIGRTLKIYAKNTSSNKKISAFLILGAIGCFSITFYLNAFQ